MTKKLLSALLTISMLFTMASFHVSAEEYPCWFSLTVQCDKNDNGSIDVGEFTEGVTVQFIDENGDVKYTEKTDEYGSVYMELAPAIYTMQFLLPEDLKFYIGHFEDYRDVDAYTDVTEPGVLELEYAPPSGAQMMAYLNLEKMGMGYFGGTIWNDTNKNRQMYKEGQEYIEFEENETPIPGATIVVRDTDGNIVESLVSNEVGSFGAEVYPVTQYIIEIIMPETHAQFAPVSPEDGNRTIRTKAGDESMEDFYFYEKAPDDVYVESNPGTTVNTDNKNNQTYTPGGSTTTTTDNPNGNKTDNPKGDETEDPNGSKTDNPKGDETEDPNGNKTDDPKGDETEDPNGSKTDDPKGDETEDPNGNKSDDPKGDEAEDPNGNNIDKPGETKTDGPDFGQTNGGNTVDIPKEGMLIDSPNGATVTVKLNKNEHYAYVMGYPDGNIKPRANITREEVATIFFRLLTDETRDASYTKTNSFTDVSDANWSNTAISTMANAGVLKGYEDGTFLPNKNITRAEFATIAAKFDSQSYIGPDKFNDISGHWAAEYINRAAMKGWISGYEDGSFRPDVYITRAEAMTLINNVLERHVLKEHMHEDMKVWPDCTESEWFYCAVQEATNSHFYTKDGAEKWTEIRATRDWKELEK